MPIIKSTLPPSRGAKASAVTAGHDCVTYENRERISKYAEVRSLIMPLKFLFSLLGEWRPAPDPYVYGLPDGLYGVILTPVKKYAS